MTADVPDPVRDLLIAPEEAGERLDRVLVKHLTELSRSRLKALVLDGRVALNGTPARDPALKIRGGDRIAVSIPPPEPAAPGAENIALSIVYEDDAIIIIDKPKGLVV